MGKKYSAHFTILIFITLVFLNEEFVSGYQTSSEPNQAYLGVLEFDNQVVVSLPSEYSSLELIANNGKLMVSTIEGDFQKEVSLNSNLTIEAGNTPQTLYITSLPKGYDKSIEIRENPLIESSLTVVINRELNLSGENILISATNILVEKPLNASSVKLISKDSTLVKSDIITEGRDIEILGKNVFVCENANIISGGGTVYIGGDEKGQGNKARAQHTFISPKATIDVSTPKTGDGGKVIIWSEEKTQFYGQIIARGGKESGNGGFVEVSSKGVLEFRGNVDNSAENGSIGTLLLDPQNITIVNAGGGADDGQFGPSDTEILEGDGGALNFTISETVLEGLSGNVILEATNDITISDLTTDGILTLNPVVGTLTIIADADNDGAGDFIMTDAANDNIITNGWDIYIEGASIDHGIIENNSIESSNITLVAKDGNVTGRAIRTNVSTGAGTNNAGNIEVNASGNVNYSGFPSFDTSIPTGETGNAGNVTIEANGININQILANFTDTGGPGLGNGGDVTLTSDNSIIVGSSGTEGINTSGRVNGGSINLRSTGNVVSFAASTELNSSAGGFPIANAGAIQIVANGSISIHDIIANSTDQGGDVFIQDAAVNSSIINSINTSSSGAGRAGDVYVSFEGNITLSEPTTSISAVSPTANGAAVTVISESGSVVLLGNINAQAGFQGAEISLNGQSGVATRGIEAHSTANGSGGELSIKSEATVNLDTDGGNIDIRGGGTTGNIGGTLEIFAEEIDITGSGNIVGDAFDANGTIRFATHGILTPLKVGGSAVAGSLDLETTELAIIDQTTFQEIIIGKPMYQGQISLGEPMTFGTSVKMQGLGTGGTFSASTNTNSITVPDQSNIILQFANDIAIGDLTAPAGDIGLQSDEGEIRTLGNNTISTANGTVGGGNITILAAVEILMNNSAIDVGGGANGSAGDVYITSVGTTEFGYIHADSDIGGDDGGNVTIVSASDIRALSSANDALSVDASVSTYGNNGVHGNILIRHNNGNLVPQLFNVSNVLSLGESGTTGRIHAGTGNPSYNLGTPQALGEYVSTPTPRLIITRGNSGTKQSANGGGNWSNPNSWSPVGVPTLFDDVEITNANSIVAQSGDFPLVNSLTVNGGLSNAGNTLMSIENSLQVNATGGFDLNFGELEVGGDLTIQNGATLNFVDGVTRLTGDGVTITDNGTTTTNLGELIIAGTGVTTLGSNIGTEKLIIGIISTLNTNNFDVGIVDRLIVTGTLEGGTSGSTISVGAGGVGIFGDYTMNASNLIVTGPLLIDGTLDASSAVNNQITVGGNYIQDGIFLGNQSTVVLTGTGPAVIGGFASPNVLFDNLEIASNANIVLGSPISVKNLLTGSLSSFDTDGNDIVITGSDIDINGSFIADGYTTFFGNSTQTIGGAGSVPIFKKIEIDNQGTHPSNNLELSRNIDVSGAGSNVGFVNGYISGTGVLQVSNRTTKSGSLNNTTHIAAPIQMTFEDDENVRILSGNGSQYAPIQIDGTIGDSYLIQYFGNGANSLSTDNSTVNAVSPSEYWHIESIGGPYTVNEITLLWNDTWRESQITDATNIGVANFTGGTWSDEGTIGQTGNTTVGSVSSGSFVVPNSGGTEITFGNLIGGTNTFGITSSITYAGSLDIVNSPPTSPVNFDFSSDTNTPRGVAFSSDGFKFFLFDGSASRRILEYRLSTPFDVSTVTADPPQTLNIGGFPQFDTPQAICFNLTGTRLYVAGRSDAGLEEVAQYNLSSAFDITSATFIGFTSNINGVISGSNLSGIAVSNDGTKLFVQRRNNPSEIFQFELTTPFEISSISTLSEGSIDLQALTSAVNFRGMAFDASGKQLFVISTVSKLLYQFSLTNPFDITTGVNFEGFFDVSANITNTRGITFNPTQSKLYINDVSGTGKTVQYSLQPIGFTESATDDGSVKGSLTVSLSGSETFVSASAVESNLSFSNLPAGLTPSVELALNNTMAIITLTGNAMSNNNANDVTDLQVTFGDGAFTGGNASSVTSAIVANTGTSINFIEVPTRPAGNNGLYFDGVDDYVDMGNPVELSAPNILTMGTWVKFDDLTSDQEILSKSTGFQGIELLAVDFSGSYNLSFFLMESSANYSHVNYPMTNFNKGEWYHLAVTWDGSTKESMRLYVNGVAVGTRTDIGDINSVGITDPANGFFVGTWATATNRFFKGQIDEVKVFETRLSQSQIQVEMANTSPTIEVGYWNFNDGTQTNADDLGTGNNDGTLTNGPLWAYRVTRTADDTNAGSLRWAINESNNDVVADKDYIDFSFEGAAPYVISPGTVLPTITEDIIIDGYSQYGSLQNDNSISDGTNATLQVILEGGSLGGTNDGLTFSGVQATVQGLGFANFGGSGISVNGGTADIFGNFIGTNPFGTNAASNDVGIELIGGTNHQIGGISPEQSNLISGNSTAEISITAAAMGVNVQRNYVGTDRSGNASIAVSDNGISIDGANNISIGGNTENHRNIITANPTLGVAVETTNSGANNITIQGNYIGVGTNGTTSLGTSTGVLLTGGTVNNVLGGASVAEGNIIANHSNIGVLIEGGATDNQSVRYNQIYNNTIGIQLATNGNNNQVAPVIISATSTTILGTCSCADGDVIDIYIDNVGTPAQGVTHIGETTVTGGTWTLAGTFTIGDILTAISTNSTNGSSEFSVAFTSAVLEDYYWVGPANGIWDNPLHWAATSSGTPGAGVPFPTSTAIIDNTGTAPLIIDNDVQIANIELRTANADVTFQSPATQLIVTNNVIIDAGLFELQAPANINNLILNGGRLDADIQATITGDVTVNGTGDLEIDNNLSIGGSLIVNGGGTAELLGGAIVTVSGDLLNNGGNFVGTGEYVLDGNASFGNPTGVPVVFPNNINFIIEGDVMLVSEVAVDGALTLTGNLNTGNYELKVGDFPSEGDLIIAGGTIEGTLGHSIQTGSEGVFEYPFKDFPLSINVTAINTGGEIFIRFDSTNPNPITEFSDNGDPITELFPEGTFRIESVGADITFDISITNYSVIPTDETTRILTGIGNIWQGEGSNTGSTSRSGLSITNGQIKRIALGSSCSELRVSPVVSLLESDTIACTFDEIFFTLLGATDDTEQVYSFYNAKEGGNNIDNLFEQDEENPNLYRPITESLLGSTFYATITTPNGCESKTGRTPIVLDLAPPITTPQLAEVERRFATQGNLLLNIVMDSELLSSEKYVVTNPETDSVLTSTLNDDGDILLDLTFLDSITFNEDRLFSSEVAVLVENSEGCQTDTILVPYDVVPFPEVSIGGNDATAGNEVSRSDQGGIRTITFTFCEGDLIELILRGRQIDRERYVILEGNPEIQEVINNGGAVGIDFSNLTQFSDVAAEFDVTENEGNQVVYNRVLPVGTYSYFATVQDTVYNVASPTPVQLVYNVIERPNKPVVREEESALVICQNEELTIALDPIGGNFQYRWYNSSNTKDALPFEVGNNNEFTFQSQVGIFEDITEGKFYVETYNLTTNCASDLTEVSYFVLKQPDQPQPEELRLACEGDSVKFVLAEQDLSTSAGLAFDKEEFVVTKNGEIVYKGTQATFNYFPLENETEGSFDVSVLRTYEINREVIECESLPAETKFRVNKRPVITKLETQPATCSEGGVLQLNVQLDSTDSGSPIRASHILFYTLLDDRGEPKETVERIRTPDVEGLIEILDLAVGKYTLQVAQVDNPDSEGNLCQLSQEMSFTIEKPESPEIITEKPETIWDCQQGSFINIQVDYKDAKGLTFQWQDIDGNIIKESQTVINDTLSLLNVGAGSYRLIIEATENKYCQADTTIFEMIEQEGVCSVPIAEEEIENLCTLKNNLPERAQSLLNWPSCPEASNDPEEWRGANFNEQGRLITLDLSQLGLEDIPLQEIQAFEELTSINLGENSLDFDDLELLLPIVDEVMADGQSPIGEPLNEVRNITQDITLNIPDGASGNNGIVTWFFIPEGEARENGEIVGSGLEITIENTRPEENQGTYYAEITHPDFPDVVIFRSDIDLTITQKMIESDRAALITVFNTLLQALQSSNGRAALSFNEDAPAASWSGVIQELDRCVGLDLSGLGLQGVIPEEIGELTELRRLSLFDNQLSGTLPESLANLTELTYLDLDKNNLSGPVSESITQLNKLQTLWLSRNAFTSIPESIGNLTDLEFLLLQDNQFTTLPQSLENLDSLIVLDISRNNLQEFLPEIPRFERLEKLNLSENRLERIQLSVSLVPNLKELNLSNNNLKDLPVGLPIAQNLTKLLVGRNRLEFDDLEPLNLSITEYSPQKRQEGDEVLVVPINSNISFSANIGGTQNQYLWYKDGDLITDQSQNIDSLVINSVTKLDAGEYECLVTSPLIPNLVLESRRIVLSEDCGELLSAEITTFGNLVSCEGEDIYVELKANSVEGSQYTWLRNDEVLPLATDSILIAFLPGKYKVRVKEASGCISTSEEVEIYQTPTLTIEVNVEGSTLTASTNGNSNEIFWFRDGIQLQQVTGSIINIEASGIYQAAIDNGQGCITKSAPQLFNVTALEDEFETGPLVLYPNPTKGALTVQFPATQKEVILILRHTDGKELAYYRHQNVEEVLINLQGLPKGLYLLEIDSEQGHVLKKLTKL